MNKLTSTQNFLCSLQSDLVTIPPLPLRSWVTMSKLFSPPNFNFPTYEMEAINCIIGCYKDYMSWYVQRP